MFLVFVIKSIDNDENAAGDDMEGVPGIVLDGTRLPVTAVWASKLAASCCQRSTPAATHH